jgi:uncharacterized membrane protein YfcA
MFLATVFRTVFGFGEALVAVPLLALIVSIQVAAPVAVLASIVIASFIVVRDWRHIHIRGAAWLVFSTLFGLPIGLSMLKWVPEPAMKAILSIFIFAFCGYSLLRPRKLFLEDERFALVFGFVAGIAGGSYGMNGPPLAIYGALRGWAPERFRATLQGYFLPASILGLCGYGAAGLWTTTVNSFFLASLPAIAAGIFVGRKIGGRIDARRFSRVLHFGLLGIATLLMVQSVKSIIILNGYFNCTYHPH